MYNTILSAFSDSLKREGRPITIETPYNVLFRRNSDKNSTDDKLTIFYSTDTPIQQGKAISYKDKIYFALNQETPENDVYYKSDLLKSNTTIQIIIGGTEIRIPAYSYDLADGLGTSNNVMSIISGNLHLFTELNDTTKQIALNYEFDALGRHWKVNNVIMKDGFIHLYAEIAATKNTQYTITIENSKDTYSYGDTAQLSAVTKMDDTILTGGTITWDSTNTSIATVDNTGLVSFLTEGTVTISATWEEHNVSDSKQITVSKPVAYSLTIDNAETSYKTIDTPTLTATAKADGVADTTATITWVSSDTSIATIDSTGKVTFVAAGSVTITATWTEHNVNATAAITVEEGVTTLGIAYMTHNNGNLYADTDTLIVKTGKSAFGMPVNAIFKDNNGNVVNDVTPVWNTSDYNGIKENNIHLSPVDDYPNRINVSVDADDNLIGATFILHLTNADNTYTEHILNCKIMSLY